MATEPTPQQLITQSAQATADAIVSALTARTSIHQRAHLQLGLEMMPTTLSSFFDIPWRTGSFSTAFQMTVKHHLQYVFAALGTKSLEMHVQWMPTEEE